MQKKFCSSELCSTGNEARANAGQWERGKVSKRRMDEERERKKRAD